MRRDILVVITIVAVTAALVATPALGGQTRHVKTTHPSCWAGSPMFAEKHAKKAAALHEKYAKQIKAVYKEYEGKKIEITEKIEALAREIDTIAEADEPDLKKLESSLKKMSDLRFELTELQFRIHKEARAVADEADRAAFDRHFAMKVGGCGGTVDHSMCLPGCTPGILGEKHIEVLLDEEDDGMRRIEVLLEGEHDATDHFEIVLDEEDLKGDVRRIIKRIRATPGDEADELIWKARGGSVGPL